jgi:hypothetical protein
LVGLPQRSCTDAGATGSGETASVCAVSVTGSSSGCNVHEAQSRRSSPAAPAPERSGADAGVSASSANV